MVVMVKHALITLIAAGVLAGLAAGAPAGPAPAVISAALTPAVNARLAAARVPWRFARAVCVREATPGRYLCTAAHVLNGVPVDPSSDVWEVIVVGRRFTYAPASVCPLVGRLCVHTDLTPLTAG